MSESPPGDLELAMSVVYASYFPLKTCYTTFMARSTCKVCQHPQVADINRALASGGASQATIGASFGLTQTVICRHKNQCIAPALAKAIEKQALISGATLISDVATTRGLLADSMHKCALSDNHSALAPLAGASFKGVELLAKLAGLPGFQPASSTVNQVAIDARGSQFALVLPFREQAQSTAMEQLAPCIDI